MRVIAGQFKGRKLLSARNSDIRPATDSVKETIFNVLQNRILFDGIVVLDLFAGTGSLGIEAISRGAAHSYFVDTEEKSLGLVRDNIGQLRCEPVCTVVKADAMEFMETADKQFDLIFADPPYAFKDTAMIPEIIFRKNLLKKKGFLIIEHLKSTKFPDSPQYQLAVRKEFGQTEVSFFSKR